MPPLLSLFNGDKWSRNVNKSPEMALLFHTRRSELHTTVHPPHAASAPFFPKFVPNYRLCRLSKIRTLLNKSSVVFQQFFLLDYVTLSCRFASNRSRTILLCVYFACMELIFLLNRIFEKRTLLKTLSASLFHRYISLIVTWHAVDSVGYS